ncbi:aldo/keto reductase [Pseudobutyrivibrio sp.]|uniref:aldo/keto reductase n=1 Tax=Pseudobutyrivibrio sp. TaxID=2014367 RepID=UPI0025FCE016|nr:aldo/keto reductase [Pseudobutyrivibrio sp.]MBR5649462.1 aldo/keto reductase [Pseudobutyrivibrio sp.]
MAERYFGENTPKLGFGLMRLPKEKDNPTKIDIERTKDMVDMFMKAGLTYFDTAFVYDGGESEKAAKLALVDRYPRESYTLATKLASFAAHDEASAKQELLTSLERTGAGYIDYYLLHALQEGNYKKYDEWHLWDYVKEMKEKGLIKHWGFSFHSTPERLDELLTAHPDAEFVQLQINYADWNNPDVQSRACYEVARKHGKSIVVMEPIKGGTLANPPKAVRDLLKSANPNLSVASWAIRFVASLDGIISVLSGMSTEEQMEDNLSYMTDFKPLSEEEKQVIKKAQDILDGIDSIPCTSCHYCTDGCPMQIPIPEIFSARNKQLIWEQKEAGQADYDKAVASRGLASACIQCGQCEGVCPQHIDIINRLQDCAAAFE